MGLLAAWGHPSGCRVSPSSQLRGQGCAGRAGAPSPEEPRALFAKASRISTSCVFILRGWKPDLGHGPVAQAFLCGQTDTKGRLTQPLRC